MTKKRKREINARSKEAEYGLAGAGGRKSSTLRMAITAPCIICSADERIIIELQLEK